MAEIVEEEEISVALSIPIELVKGVLDGSIDEEKLKEFNPSKPVTVIERQVITRGQVIGILQNSPLAAEIAMFISTKHATAVIDLEQYPVLPLYCGMSVEQIPQFTNLLWDIQMDKKEYIPNLFVYSLPERNLTRISEVVKNFPTVVINCPIDLWEDIYPLVNILYIPVPQNIAGIHTIRQILAKAPQCEEKFNIVWIKTDSLNESQCLSIIRRFSNIQVAGQIPELGLEIKPQKHQRYIAQILESLFPEIRRNGLNGLLSIFK